MEREQTLKGHAGSVFCVAFHPVLCSLLASSGEGSSGSSGGGEVLLWDTARGSILAQAAGFKCAVQVVCFEASPASACQAGEPCSVLLGSGCELWRQTFGVEAGGAPPAAAVGAPQLLAKCGDDVAALAVHPTLPLLAAADDEGCITVVDLQAGAAVRVLRKGGHTSLCTGALFSPCGAGLVSAGCDQRLLVWDVCSDRTPLLATDLPELLLLRDLEVGSGGGSAEGLGAGFNPPHILCLASGPAPAGGAGSSAGGLGASALFAGALGDGALVAVALSWDTTGKRKRPALAVQWVERSLLSPACAVATVPCTAGAAGGDDAEGGGEGQPSRLLLVSASNSGRVRVWDWASIAAGGARELASWTHGAAEGKRRRKINWLAGSPSKGGLLAIADTGRTITVLSLPQVLASLPAAPGV